MGEEKRMQKQQMDTNKRRSLLALKKIKGLIFMWSIFIVHCYMAGQDMKTLTGWTSLEETSPNKLFRFFIPLKVVWFHVNKVREALQLKQKRMHCR